MGIFKKKKKEEEELEEEKETENLPPSKKTPPAQVKRKKSPPKEWGKKERIVILFVFLTTVGSSGYLALRSRSWKLPGIPRVQLPSLPSFSFIESETITIEGDRTNIEKRQKIVDQFVQISQNLTGIYGIYIIHLDDGFSFGVNEKEIFEPASLNKLPVMIASYRMSEFQQLDLSVKYILKNSDKIKGSGTMQYDEEGAVYSYQDMLDLMGQKSDNTAYGIMRKTVGEENLLSTLKEIGISKNIILDNITTPEEVGQLFKSTYSGKVISNASRDLLLKSLTDTIYEDYLPSGIPDGIDIAHKYGREVHVVNDAGIVFSDEPYVIVIMSKGIDDKEAEVAIPAISKMVYEIESN